MNLAEKIVEIIKTQDGVEEHPRGSNSGPEVNEYLASVHLAPGAPWCAALVSYDVMKAEREVGGPAQFKPSGSALGLVRNNPGLVVDAPGDDALYIGIKEDADHVHGHAFFVFPETNDVGNYPTFEGNTNDDGSREGYKACYRTRQPNEIKYFLRIG